jgi:hypothetical protein
VRIPGLEIFGARDRHFLAVAITARRAVDW